MVGLSPWTVGRYSSVVVRSRSDKIKAIIGKETCISIDSFQFTGKTATPAGAVNGQENGAQVRRGPSKNLSRRRTSQSSCGRSRRNKMKIRHFRGYALRKWHLSKKWPRSLFWVAARRSKVRFAPTSFYPYGAKRHHLPALLLLPSKSNPLSLGFDLVLGTKLRVSIAPIAMR